MEENGRLVNAARNVLFGSFLKIFQIVMPFVVRTCMIYYMGIEYQGLDSLFVGILQVLNLAELGVGIAMVFSMYKPIAEGDHATICALMGLYRRYYRIIGLVVAVGGLIPIPIIPSLVKGSIPAGLDLTVLYLLNLSATVMSYWLFAYCNCLLQAHQRSDMISKVTIGTSLLMYVSQIVVLLVFKDFYMFVIIKLATQLLTNIVSAIVSKKMYPDLMPAGSLAKEQVKSINQRIKDLFTAKLGGAILNASSTLVVSSFLGLATLAIFQNYLYVATALSSFVAIIFASCTAGIGNSLVSETKEKNYGDLRKFTFILTWLSGVFACCMLCSYQPFMRVWVGEDLMLDMQAAVGFTTYFFVYNTNRVLITYKDAAGIWHQDRFRPLATSLFCLATSLLFVQIWGVYGVILSIPLSQLIVAIPWLLFNLFSNLFERSHLKEYALSLLRYVMVTLVAAAVAFFVGCLIPGSPLVVLVSRAAIGFIVPNVVFFAAYCRLPEFEQSKQLVQRILARRR